MSISLLKNYNIQNLQYVVYSQKDNFYVGITKSDTQLQLIIFQVKFTQTNQNEINILTTKDLSQLLKEKEQSLLKSLFLKKQQIDLLEPCISSSGTLLLTLNINQKDCVLIYLNISDVSNIQIIQQLKCNQEILFVLHNTVNNSTLTNNFNDMNISQNQDDIFYLISTNQMYKTSPQFDYLQQHFQVPDKQLKIKQACLQRTFIYCVLSNNQLIQIQLEQVNKFINFKKFNNNVILFFQYQDKLVNKLLVIEQLEKSENQQQQYYLTNINYNQLNNVDVEAEIDAQCVNFTINQKLEKIILYQQLQKDVEFVLLQTAKNDVISLNIYKKHVSVDNELNYQQEVDCQLTNFNQLINNNTSNQPNNNQPSNIANTNLQQQQLQNNILFLQLQNYKIQEAVDVYNDQLSNSETFDNNNDLYKLHLYIKATDAFQRKQIIQLQCVFFSQQYFGLMDVQQQDQEIITSITQLQTVEQINFLLTQKLQLNTQNYIANQDQILSQQPINLNNPQLVQDIIQQIYAHTPQKLSDVLIFKMLRDNQLFKVLMNILQLYEQRVGLQQQNAVVYNVRGVSLIAQFIIQQSIQLLIQTHSLFNKIQENIGQTNYNQSSGNEMQTFNNLQELLKKLETPVENSVRVLVYFSQTRGQVDDSVVKAQHATIKGELFIGMSRFFQNFLKSSNYCEDTFYALSLPVENNEKLEFVNFIYTEQFGFYKNTNFKFDNQQDTCPDQFLDSDNICNTAISLLIQQINNILGVQNKKYTINGIFDSIISYIQEIEQRSIHTSQSNNSYYQNTRNSVDEIDYNQIQQDYQQLFIILRIFFIYMMLTHQIEEHHIFKSLKNISLQEDQIDKIYLLGRIFFECDQNDQIQTNDKAKAAYDQFLQINGNLQEFKYNIKKPDNLYKLLTLIGQNILGCQQSKINTFVNIQKIFSLNDLEEFKFQIVGAFDLIKLSINVQNGQFNLNREDLIVKLTHTATLRQKFPLALGLAQFCYSDTSSLGQQPNINVSNNSNENQYYIFHPCNSTYENTLRILLLRYQLTKESSNIQKAVVYLKNYFKEASQYGLFNQRMAILYCQMITKQISFSKFFPNNEVDNTMVNKSVQETQSIDISNLNVSNLLKSCYSDLNQSGFKQAGVTAQLNNLINSYDYNDLMQQLLIHQQLTDVEKRLLINYCLQNSKNYAFLLTFLYNQDLILCQKLYYYCENNILKNNEIMRKNTKLEEAIAQIASKLNQLPKFMSIQNKNIDIKQFNDKIFEYNYIQPQHEVGDVNVLAFSLSIVQNDNKQDLFQQIINKKPQELILLKDAMQQMKEQMNNQLPSQYYKYNNYQAQQLVNNDNINANNQQFNKNCPQYIQNYVTGYNQYNNQNAYQQQVNQINNPQVAQQGVQIKPVLNVAQNGALQVRMNRAFELKMKALEQKKQEELLKNQQNQKQQIRIPTLRQNLNNQANNQYIANNQYNTQVRQPYQPNNYNANNVNQNQPISNQYQNQNTMYQNNNLQQQQINNPYTKGNPANNLFSNYPTAPVTNQMVSNQQNSVVHQPNYQFNNNQQNNFNLQTPRNIYGNNPVNKQQPTQPFNKQEEQPIQTKYTTQNIDIYSQKDINEIQVVQARPSILKNVQRPGIQQGANMVVSPNMNQPPRNGVKFDIGL